MVRSLRFELGLLVFCFLCWVATLVTALADRPFAGTVEIGLYGLYGSALVLGWLGGNVYNLRTRDLPRLGRRWMMTLYVLGPPGVFFLAWALTPLDSQQAVPLAPAWAYGVYVIFFMVPVSFRHTPRR